jgi:Tfp pilus assembly protein PilW
MTSQVRDTGWFKCSSSASSGSSCIEVRITNAGVGVRDSKNQSGPSFVVGAKAWEAFVALVLTT